MVLTRRIASDCPYTKPVSPTSSSARLRPATISIRLDRSTSFAKCAHRGALRHSNKPIFYNYLQPDGGSAAGRPDETAAPASSTKWQTFVPFGQAQPSSRLVIVRLLE